MNLRKLDPGTWSVRTMVAVILTIGAIGLIGGGR